MRLADPRQWGRTVAAGLSGLWLLLSACGEVPVAPDVVARIEDREIRYLEFESYLEASLVESPDGVDVRVLGALFEQFLDEELLLELAREEIPDAVGAAADTDRRHAVIALLARETGGQVREAELVAYYEAHTDEFARPERVRLRQILVADKEALARVQADLEDGMPFAEAGQLHSETAGLSPGAGTWILARDELPPAFAEPVFGLEPAEISEPIATEYGFHIFQVTERYPAERLPLELVEEEIRGVLDRQRRDRQLAQLVAEAKRRYNVKLYRENLPFPVPEFNAEEH